MTKLQNIKVCGIVYPDNLFFRRQCVKIQISDTTSGLLYSIFASLSFSLMVTCVYLARVIDPLVSSTVVSFVRVAVNLVILLVPAFFSGDVLCLFGDGRLSLWLRGVFGSLALILFFFAVQSVGIAESTFIHSSNGIFIILLCPLFLSEKFSFRSLFAIAGSLLGLYFLFDPHLNFANWEGKSIALAAGFFAALSNLMVARAGRSNTPECVVFYFCFVSLFIHLPYFFFYGFILPSGLYMWLAMIGAGVFASIGQILITKAYQLTKAGMVTAVSYLGPVFSLLWSVLFFQQSFTERSLLGCFLILVCGTFLPFLKTKK